MAAQSGIVAEEAVRGGRAPVIDEGRANSLLVDCMLHVKLSMSYIYKLYQIKV